MPSAFLTLCHGALDPSERARIAERAESLLPFVHTTADTWTSPDEQVSVYTWSCFEAAARGSYTHATARALTSFDGTLVEDAPLAHTVARALHDWIERDGFHHVLSRAEGSYTAVHCDARGVVYAARAISNAQHLYYGKRGHITAVSNRAMLVAAALERGGPPRLKKDYFAWWASTSMAPLTFSPMPWEGVKLLEPSQMLTIRRGRVDLLALAAAKPYESWEEARAAHIERCNVWTRLPGARTRLPLTGGKDSRAILAGLLAQGTHEQLDHAYISAPPGLPDLTIARELTARCGVELVVDDLDDFIPTSLMEQMRVHLFRTECRLHTWDVKALKDAPHYVALGGHYGELYRSHVSHHLLLGWRGVKRLLAAPGQIDKFSTLGKESVEMLRAHTLHWIARHRAQGVDILDVRDLWHREARMWQWATDAMRADSLGGVTWTPLVSARQLEVYDRQSLLERRAERTHYELMQVAPSWLWRHRFAQAMWRRELTPWSRRPHTPGHHVQSAWTEHSRQHKMWAQSRDEIVAFLCDEDASSSFQDVFDLARVRAAVGRYVKTESPCFDGEPDQLLLKGLFGLLGAKLMVERGFASVKLSTTAPAQERSRSLARSTRRG